MSHHHQLKTNTGDTHARLEARTVRLLQEARLFEGTTRTPRNPPHLSLVLVRQRVEVKTSTEEIIGVVTEIRRSDGFCPALVLAPPLAWEARGFWTHYQSYQPRLFYALEIERLTMLEGPAKQEEKEI